MNVICIGLGEIEIVLSRHAAVREAVVVAKGGQLIAHVQGGAAVGELRDHLASQLPAYMVPGEFRLVEDFPLTPNGRIDRLALLAATPDNAPAAAAGTSIEAEVLALWSEVLGSPATDATANFFDLGGNSIDVAIIHVRLMEMTGRRIPITELFALPTARSIAEFLSPKSGIHAGTTAHARARLAQAGLSRFRRRGNR